MNLWQQDQIIEEIEEMGRRSLAVDEGTRTKKEEPKRMQGARKPRKDEEVVWAPPRNISQWPGWEEAREKGKKVNGA